MEVIFSDSEDDNTNVLSSINKNEADPDIKENTSSISDIATSVISETYVTVGETITSETATSETANELVIDDIDDIPDDVMDIIEINDITNDKTAQRTLTKKDIIQINLRRINTLDVERQHSKPSDIRIDDFDDERPLDDKYFEKSEHYGKAAKGLGVVVPFFNESNTAVQQTLNSLYNGWNYLRVGSKKWRNKPLYVCLIQDGWYKADESMKEYLKALFPKKIKDHKTQEEKYWWDYYKDFNYAPDELKNAPDRTFVLSRKKYGNTLINPQSNFNDKKYMRITVIIKIHNRRKHNSHEWFFGKNGFGDCINTEYLFFTDAFAMYSNWCIFHLVKSLDRNSQMVAVTGRQRLMSKRQQGSQESSISIDTLLRMVQLYDFESSNVIYNGAFSLGGMLPVIPGPCGMYRASNILDDNVRDYYFSTVNQDPDTTGMVLGNLRIAEDRILTYASVVKSSIAGAYMEFNQLAVFYFEAETDLDTLIFQRRRWINGSVAGYIYLLFYNFQHYQQWKSNTAKKIYIWILLMIQFLTYIMVGMSPSVTLRIFYHGINYFLNYYGVSLSFDLVIIGIIVWAIYLLHVCIHHTYSKFNYIMMYSLMILSVITSSLAFGSLLHYAFVKQGLNVLDILMSQNITLYLSLYVFFGPFIVSLLLSGKGHSFLFMLKSFIPYYLFLPMFITWFGSYSYARLWDLSWGNRPANEMDSVSASKKDKIMKKFKSTNKKIIAGLFIINIGLFLIPVEGQMIIMNIFFAIAAYQLTLSIFYCIYKLFYKMRFCCTKAKISKKDREKLQLEDMT